MFFTKNKGPKITTTIFLNEQGFTKAISEWLQQNPGGAAISWFQLDLDNLRTHMPSIAADRFVLADRLGFSHTDGKQYLFAGHYPIHQSELDLYANLGLTEILVYAHLAMPLFRSFGSDNIVQLMIKMGMKEDEPIDHPMITKAITNAQEKIAKNCSIVMQATSQQEWMNLNAPQTQ